MATSLAEPYVDSEEETNELVVAHGQWVSIKDAVDTMVTKLECDAQLVKENDDKRKRLAWEQRSPSQLSAESLWAKDKQVADRAANQYSNIMDDLINKEAKLRREVKRLKRLLWPKNGCIMDEYIKLEGLMLNRIMRVQMLACRTKACLEECVPTLHIDLTHCRHKNTPLAPGFPGPAMFSVDTQDNKCWARLPLDKYTSMTDDIRRTVMNELGDESYEIMHSMTVVYAQSGPKFLDSSAADARCDYARFGALLISKIQQTHLSNIELNVGGCHKCRVGATTCVYSPKGSMLKRKKPMRIKIHKNERQCTIFRADETNSDTSDEEYMCPSE